MIFKSTSRVAPENQSHTGRRAFLNMGMTDGVIEMAKIDRDRELKTRQLDVARQLQYNPDTGKFFRKDTNKPAGSYNQKGYLRIQLQNGRFVASRLAWLLYYGEWPEKTVDHINGDPSDNRIDNLRLATDSEQQWNKGVNRNNTSGIKGVSFNKRRNEAGLPPWEVYITVYYKRIHVGFFNDLENAIEARQKAAMTYHGNFSNGCLQWA